MSHCHGVALPKIVLKYTACIELQLQIDMYPSLVPAAQMKGSVTGNVLTDAQLASATTSLTSQHQHSAVIT